MGLVVQIRKCCDGDHVEQICLKQRRPCQRGQCQGIDQTEQEAGQQNHRCFAGMHLEAVGNAFEGDAEHDMYIGEVVDIIK